MTVSPVSLLARTAVALACALIMCAGAAWSAPAGDASLYALFVGVNAYPPPLEPLEGPVGDVARIKAELVARWGLIADGDHVLDLSRTQAQETRQGIAAAFATLVRRAALTPGATVVFYYAGHGARLEDDSGDDASGYASTIVPVDGRRSGEPVRDIRGSELRAMVDAANRLGVNVVTIFDSCHSGGATRAVGRYRSRRAPDVAASQLAGAEPIPVALGGPPAPVPGVSIHIAAAGDAELSLEVQQADGAWHGLFTSQLAEVLATLPKDATYADLLDRLSRAMRLQPIPAGASPSHPNAVGSLGARVLSSEGRDDLVLRAVRKADGAYAVDGGTLTGVRAGQRFRAYLTLADSRRGGAAAAFDGVIDTAGATRSTLVVAAGTVGQAPPGRAVYLRPSAVVSGFAPLRLRIEAPASAATGIREQLKPLDFVLEDRAADLSLSLTTDGRVQFRDRSSGFVSYAWPIASAADYAEVLGRVSKAAYVWRTPGPASQVAMDIVQPDCTVEGRCDVLGPDATSGAVELCEGDTFALRMLNRGGTDQHVTVLHLGSDQNIDMVYPPHRGDDEVLPAGHAVVYANPGLFTTMLPAGRRDAGFDEDRLVLVVTEQRMSNFWFAQPGVAAARPKTRGADGAADTQALADRGDAYAVVRLRLLTRARSSGPCSGRNRPH